MQSPVLNNLQWDANCKEHLHRKIINYLNKEPDAGAVWEGPSQAAQASSWLS